MIPSRLVVIVVVTTDHVINTDSRYCAILSDVTQEKLQNMILCFCT